jgi:protein disulfide-isomerase-like protein
MPMPKVTTSVVDLSTRVSATGTYNSAIVVAAKKGPIDTPTLVTSQTDFLERFTPNETLQIGWDTALYEAYIYLAQHSNLYVVRCANTTGDSPALYGGAHIRTYKSSKEHESLDAGFLDVVEHTYNAEGGVPDVTTKHYDTPDDVIDLDNDAFVIYGSSQGAWNNDLAVTIITDPDKVKLDGAFILNVYKNKALVETWTCSLDPSLKNGYGVNCYAETVLTASNYVRADVSDAEDIIKETSYPLTVTGTIAFENEVVKSDNLWLILFYAPWCGHCRAFHPQFEKLAKASKGVFKIGAVNCENDRELAQKYKVTGYPTVYFFGEDKTQTVEYEGERKAEKIVEFLFDKAKNVINNKLNEKKDVKTDL